MTGHSANGHFAPAAADREHIPGQRLNAQ